MERIICDIYIKGEKRLWDIDVDNPKNQDFNRKILAVNNVYGWLYNQGILKKVSFEFKDYSDSTYFAFDTKDLEFYRDEILKSGVTDAALAVHHIFEKDYEACLFSGAIELGWTMFTYRDFAGTISRSWECDLCSHLNSASVSDIKQVRNEQGVKQAVKLMFDLSGFFPSDISKNGELMVVRPLTEDDKDFVWNLDELSGYHLSDALKDNKEYAWGVFVGERLAGYCSIGYADEFVDDGNGNGYPKCTPESILLENVFVSPNYRKQGCGSYMVDEAIRKFTENYKQRVFLPLLDSSLSGFYQKVGFSTVGEGVMMRDERSLDEIKWEEEFEQAFAYYSNIDKSMIGWRDYLFSHADKLISCYERGEHLDLIDVDCWVRYEELLGERLDFDEYCALNSAFDDDPHDIEITDNVMISRFKEILNSSRSAAEIESVDTLLENASENVVIDNTEKSTFDLDKY